MEIERIAKMEVKISHLEDRAKKMEDTLCEVGDIAKSTKWQLIAGVGTITAVIEILAKVF